MKFQEWICSDLNQLFGCDLGWEYGSDGSDSLNGELPPNTPVQIKQQCDAYVDLSNQIKYTVTGECDRQKTPANALLVRDFQSPDTPIKERLTLKNKLRQLLGIDVVFSLKAWAKSQGLTAYCIGRTVSSVTGESANSVRQRWQRWLTVGEGLTTVDKISSDLNAMGYRLAIKEK